LDTGHLILAGAILLAVTGLALLAANRLHVGSIVALLAVGLIVGPHSPYPVFQAQDPALEGIGDIGVMLLIFVVALDIQPSWLWQRRRMVLRLGAAQYLVSALAIAALLLLVTSAGWRVALVLGLAAAMSSSAIAFPLLARTGGTATPRGHAVVAIDVFQGFMVPAVLIAIPILANRGGGSGHLDWTAAFNVVLAIAALVLLARLLMPFALRTAAQDLGSGAFTLLVLGGVLFAAWITEAVGLSAAAGAFAIGVLLSTSLFAAQIRAVVTPAKNAFLALFFLSIGMAIDPAELFAMRYQLLLFLPGVFAVKLAVGYGAGRLGHLSSRDALLASLLLMPLDEIAYVIFSSARDSGLLDSHIYAISLAVLSASFVAAPLAINLGMRLASSAAGTAPPSAGETAKPPAGRFVLQFGYGRLGQALCAVMERAQVPYMCIDDKLEHLLEASRRGHNVRFGFVDRESSLDAFGISKANLVVVAIEGFAYAKRLLGFLRAFHPRVPLRVAVPFLTEREELRAMGVGQAYAVVPEGALTFGRSVLDALGVEERCVDLIVDSLRADDYAALRPRPSPDPISPRTPEAA
jgi:Kef-type K+ transport system membrane component KefB